MTQVKCFLIVLTMLSALSVAHAEGKEAKGADAQNIDTACAADSATAGCGAEKVGTGLLKCLHAYKQAHKDNFKFSDSCHAAMKKMHEDHKGHEQQQAAPAAH